MLAISTATKKAYIGIDYKGKKFYSEINADCKQSENILKEIDNLLEKNNLNFKDIGNIAVVVGPGSFTGIRIGVALVKGLCAGDSNHSVYPISTLDLMSRVYQKTKKKSEYYCVMNALSNRIFYAKYDKNGKKISEEEMIGLDEANIDIHKMVFLCEEFKNLDGGVNLDAETLLDYALELERTQKGIDAKELKPVYIRKSQAEENIQ